MSILHRLAAETRARLAIARADRDAGQGTLEYAGIAVLIGLIMVAIFGLGLDSTISQAIQDAVSKIIGG